MSIVAILAMALSIGQEFDSMPDRQGADCMYKSSRNLSLNGKLSEGSLLRRGDARRIFTSNGNTRMRLVVKEPDSIQSDWKIDFAPYGEHCSKAEPFSISNLEVERFGSALWTGSYETHSKDCYIRVQSKASDPVLVVYVYGLENKPDQLGVIDANRDTGPNWCVVDQFAGAHPDGAIRYSVKDNEQKNFIQAIDSVVSIAWVRKNPFRMNDLSSCTGFFITEDLILTNRHCVCPAGNWETGFLCPPAEEFEEPWDRVDFTTLVDEKKEELESDFASSSNQITASGWHIWSRLASSDRTSPPTFQAPGLELIGSRPIAGRLNRPLDYAIFRVDPNETPLRDLAHIRPAPLSRSDTYSADKKLAIPQYPENYPYTITYDSNCRIMEQDGKSGNLTDTSKDLYVLHGCDTSRGSSGSPVFARDMSIVVGVHNCCFDRSRDGRLLEKKDEDILKGDNKIETVTGQVRLNRFVPIHAILCDIDGRKPSLFGEIEASQIVNGYWRDDETMNC